MTNQTLIQSSAELRKGEFQTPIGLAKYMVGLIPDGVVSVLEPTPGEGNIIAELQGYEVTAPQDFFKMEKSRFDCVITNPPFSIEYAFGLPNELNKKGSQVGYHILKSCMEMSDTIIALLPWFILTNSEKRMIEIKKWGLKSVCVVPRRLFPGSRASNCILYLQKGYNGMIEFTTYDEKKGQAIDAILTNDKRSVATKMP